jgi:hypothetical protein
MNGNAHSPDALRLASGLAVADPLGRLLAFCAEEYAYYDAVLSTDPNRIDPVDVLVTVAMNSFVNTADKVRSIHRGLAEACDRILGVIPEDADLRSFPLPIVGRLLAAACQVRGVLLPVATKVLHRKRRGLIPMLDSVLIEYYLRAGADLPRAALGDSRRAGEAAVPILEAFRADLTGAWDDLTAVTCTLAEFGFRLTPLRSLELLVWTETEPRKYYRR